MTRDQLKQIILNHCANKLGSRLDRFDGESLHTDLSDDDSDEMAELIADAELYVVVKYPSEKQEVA